MTETNLSELELPGLDCGLCGFRTCTDMAARLPDKPELLKRCIPLAADFMNVQAAPAGSRPGDEAQPGGPVAPAPAPAPAPSPSPTIVNGEECASCDPAAGCAAVKRGWGNDAPVLAAPVYDPAGACATASETAATAVPQDIRVKVASSLHNEWQDHLGREFDFVLDHFPEEAGPREQIIPHNPVITRELEIEPARS